MSLLDEPLELAFSVLIEIEKINDGPFVPEVRVAIVEAIRRAVTQGRNWKYCSSRKAIEEHIDWLNKETERLVRTMSGSREIDVEIYPDQYVLDELARSDTCTPPTNFNPASREFSCGCAPSKKRRDVRDQDADQAISEQRRKTARKGSEMTKTFNKIAGALRDGYIGVAPLREQTLAITLGTIVIAGEEFEIKLVAYWLGMTNKKRKPMGKPRKEGHARHRKS